MNSDPKLDLVKALTDPDRLQLVGLLTQAPASAHDLVARTGLPFREVVNHLSFLEYVGVVGRRGEQFVLDTAKMEALNHGQEARPGYVPEPGTDPQAAKVLAAYLNPDGTIKQLPTKAAKLRVVLEYLAGAFTPGTDYTERQVNEVIRRYHDDIAGLRRDLIDSGLLQRESDGSRYWRPA